MPERWLEAFVIPVATSGGAAPEVLLLTFHDLTPMRRMAKPEEVAGAILFLASPAAAMITGHTLPVDGGFLAQ